MRGLYIVQTLWGLILHASSLPLYVPKFLAEDTVFRVSCKACPKSEQL